MPSSYQCQFLKGKKLKVFLAVANRIIPADESSPSAGTMETAGVVDWALQRMPEKLRKKLLLFFIVIELIGVFFGGKPFSKNNSEIQDRQLRWMEGGPIKLFRMGFFGVKTYICMGYYTRDDIWETFNYDGPVVSERPFADPIIRGICNGEIEVVA